MLQMFEMTLSWSNPYIKARNQIILLSCLQTFFKTSHHALV